MFHYKPATWVIIHILGHIENQFVKYHQYLLSLAYFLIELIWSHGGVWYDMGLGPSSQVDAVKDFDNYNRGKENNGVDYT